MAKAAKKRYIKTDPKRIEAIALLIEKKYITAWAGIFEYIPRTIVADHLGINHNRMKALVENPAGMSPETLAAIADFLKVEYSVMAKLAYKNVPVAKRKG